MDFENNSILVDASGFVIISMLLDLIERLNVK